jgi:hypothetical protein
MKATHEKEIQKRISFARAVEVETGKLIEAGPLDDGPAGQIYEQLNRAHNLAWALQLFPLFDPACLSRMHVQAFPELRARWNGDKTYSGGLWVPVFAAVPFGRHPTSIRRGPADSRLALCGLTVGQYPDKAIDDNRRALKEPQGYEIEARSPEVPESVLSRVNPVRDRFECVELVFEAEWAPAEVKDPLVVGRIARSFFLIDQFDVTKLERYISSEFCQKPAE